ncbi:MAG: cysteine--tRNA ligase [Patescibacteria group bacterium]|jgi:cysteinyl-tRNA synthetase
MTIRFYNTLNRKIEDFKPIKKTIGLYTCGPTVHNYAHLGNLRAFIFEDVLKRVLLYSGQKVKHIMNITDVGHLVGDTDTGEDKMEKGAAREGKTAWDIAEFYTKAFFNDLNELNILSATKYPKATDHIEEQIALIKKLEKKGFTYKTSDGIYFDTSKLKDYGKMALLAGQKLEAGARVDMGEKKNPTDFALWKFSPKNTERQMEWGSPWGIGFPGWHIECSAMAAKYLGQPFDIHCGGVDHIQIHHTNEIAQSEAAEGKQLANYWLHSEFLVLGKDKMAKSGSNFITISALKEKGINPLAYRYFVLQTHYRKQLAFSFEALQAAETGLKNLYQTAAKIKRNSSVIKEEKIIEEVENEFYNDLNLPAALGLIWEALKSLKINYKTLLKFDEVLGLDIDENVKKIENSNKVQAIPEEIKNLVLKRDEARRNKNWQDSDILRDKLEDLGYQVEDSKDGTKVRKL